MKTVSLRKAINGMCKQCIYDPFDKGSWRQQVERCTDGNCALFCVRPLPTTTPKGRSKKLVLSPKLGQEAPISECKSTKLEDGKLR